MFKKSKYILIFFVSIVIVSYGFIIVGNVMPDFIKDRSSFKVSYTSAPFDLEFDTGNYLVYINSKAAENYKQHLGDFTKNIVSNNPIKKLLK